MALAFAIAAAAFLGAFAPQPWILVVAQFLTGVGVGADFPTSASYVSEMMRTGIAAVDRGQHDLDRERSAFRQEGQRGDAAGRGPRCRRGVTQRTGRAP